MISKNMLFTTIGSGQPDIQYLTKFFLGVDNIFTSYNLF